MTQLGGFFEPWLYTFVLFLTRFGAMLASMPFLTQFVPVRLNAAFCALVSMALCVHVGPQAVKEVALSQLLVVLFSEALIGLLIGFFISLFFSVFHIAGQFMGLQMGLGFGGFIDPVMKEESLANTRLMTTLAMLIFLSSGGIEQLLLSLWSSLDHLPPGRVAIEFVLDREMWMVAQLAIVFKQALKIGMPLMIGLLMTQVLMGIFTRAVAELNIFTTSFAITVLIGLLLFVHGMAHVAGLSHSLTVSLSQQVGELLGAW